MWHVVTEIFTAFELTATLVTKFGTNLAQVDDCKQEPTQLERESRESHMENIPNLKSFDTHGIREYAHMQYIYAIHMPHMHAIYACICNTHAMHTAYAMTERWGFLIKLWGGGCRGASLARSQRKTVVFFFLSLVFVTRKESRKVGRERKHQKVAEWVNLYYCKNQIGRWQEQKSKTLHCYMSVAEKHHSGDEKNPCVEHFLWTQVYSTG